ncbi:MAG: type II secretion system inner membrane protein GspF [Candidatus Hydrogenedentes bacterium]|nr:type II secretion system inner membrane protein GspF [Candidatus Hydrogenedentota bacterium]
MAVFEYEAMATTGKIVKGVIDADSVTSARRQLREQTLYPTKLVETFGKEGFAGPSAPSGAARGRISARDVAMLTRQMAVLLHAGMPLVETLGALLNQVTNARLGKIIYDIRAKVNEGMTLANALGAHNRIFSDLYVNMVRAGESSGALEQVLFRLADIQERQVKLRSRIQSSLAYPVVMAVFGFGIIFFLMTVIVPKIVVIFTKQKAHLPMITEWLIATCTFLGRWWWALALVIVAMYSIWRAWVARPEGRRVWDRFKLRLPVFGKMYTMIISARFARTLGTMLQSGLTMMTALDVVKSVLGNRVIEESLDDVKADVRRGRDLSVPLKECGYFPAMLISMVELGQRSGELENMMLKIADTYDEDVEMSVDAVVSLLEPFMIIIMGLFVGFLVLAILLPIFSLSSTVKH